MDDEQTQEIEINGVEVDEINAPTTYTLMLFANGKDFPNLNGKIEVYEPLAYITYYVPLPNSGQEYKIFCHRLNPREQYSTWDAYKERTAVSEEEVRQIVREVMVESINHFRKLDKQVLAEPEKVEARHEP